MLLSLLGLHLLGGGYSFLERFFHMEQKCLLYACAISIFWKQTSCSTLTDSGLSEDKSCLGSYLHLVLTKLWCLQWCVKMWLLGRKICCVWKDVDLGKLGWNYWYRRLLMSPLKRWKFNYHWHDVKNEGSSWWLGREDSAFMSRSLLALEEWGDYLRSRAP